MIAPTPARIAARNGGMWIARSSASLVRASPPSSPPIVPPSATQCFAVARTDAGAAPSVAPCSPVTYVLNDSAISGTSPKLSYVRLPAPCPAPPRRTGRSSNGRRYPPAPPPSHGDPRRAAGCASRRGRCCAGRRSRRGRYRGRARRRRRTGSILAGGERAARWKPSTMSAHPAGVFVSGASSRRH